MKHEKLTMPFETHQEITSIWFTVEDIMGSVDHQGWSITNGIVKTFFGKSTNYSNQIKPGVNMLRVSLLCVCLTAILPALPCRADEEMAAVVGKVKRAVVYIRVEDPAWKGSGSGFVISVKGDTALIATNYHVIAGPNYERHPHPTPREVIKTIKSAAVTTVFDSGAKTERSLKAQAIAADAEKDLAILRVTGLKDPPTPIEYSPPSKLTETMPVYTFGFPFGQMLSAGKKSPAITIGKASVSSLRLDDDGELTTVQIDGALNPGNSGGPIVDVKGKLVGVADAIIRGGSGIGLAVPALELERMMQGHLSAVHATASKEANGKVKVKVEVEVIDPAGLIHGAKLFYLAVDPKAAKTKGTDALESRTGSRNIKLNVDGSIATTEFTLDSPADQLLLQAVPDSSDGKKPLLTPIRMVALSGDSSPAAGPDAKPPSGWRVYTPRDNAFTIWLPEKTKRQTEQERTSTHRGLRFKTTVLYVEVSPGVTYQVQRVQLLLARGVKINPNELQDVLRDSLVSELNGKITEENESPKLGVMPGKEYFIETDKGVARARSFVSSLGRNVFTLIVQGSEETVKGVAAATFLDSCRLPVAKAGTDTPGARNTSIQGGAFDPEFKELAPNGGFLVGFEVGLGKFVNNDIVKSIRPIFRVGDKESLGQQRGTDLSQVVKVVAKPGYAVGAVNVKAGLAVDGFSVTFMKINGSRLNPSDSYESEWIGGHGGNGPVKLGGNGTPVVGLLGKTNTAKDFTGLGLVLGLPGAKAGTDTPGANGSVAGGKNTSIQGGAFDPEFKELAPNGGFLVGFEVGLGKFVNNDIVKSIRPIFRVGDKESLGQQRGTDLSQVVKVVAKPGYAIGAVTVKSGLAVVGFSVTFMKIDGTRLDPKDSYESEWIGGKSGGGPVKLGGNGTPVVGLLGKTNTAKDFTGLGLVLGTPKDLSKRSE